ncbi:unnamed protein product, partial [Lampetra fluviatilis]
VLGNDGSIRRYNPRAEWQGSTESCKASITIASVETSDAGSYKCDVLLLPMYDEGQSSLQLWVSNRPGRRYIGSGLVLGNDASIRRYNPRAEWQGSTESCKASITMASVKTSDAGSYKCDVLLLPMYDGGQSSPLWVSNRPESDEEGSLGSRSSHEDEVAYGAWGTAARSRATRVPPVESDMEPHKCSGLAY